MLVPLEDLVGLSEIAELLGVHKRTAQEYLDREDFPEPLGQTRGGRVWRKADVVEWAESHRPRRGRPRKTEP
jgi:predicted DNA-binding transcriptional regulator AlpA